MRRLANLLSASAGPRFRRDFDVSLPEWRTLALLGKTQPMTVNKLARLAALDKAQMSRVVSGLVDRDLVEKSIGPRRSSQLTLTDSGQQLFERLITAANERNEQVLAALTTQEREVLDGALRKLSDAAIVIEHHENERMD
ncbi:MAG: MarR family winged helix-turn-helix transcriptional regulator [Brevibacterium sp.]